MMRYINILRNQEQDGTIWCDDGTIDKSHERWAYIIPNRMEVGWDTVADAIAK
jgi:hypothetical protein